MTTILMLNENQVYPDASLNIKLTRENPYFTQSDSYTLDVTIPMENRENIKAMGNINRMDRSKNAVSMPCLLISNNRNLLRGTARVTQITESAVKLQLLGGNSEINFLSNDSGIYIDEIPLSKRKIKKTGGRRDGYYYDNENIRTASSLVNNESDDGQTLFSFTQFCLVDIVREVIKSFGYTVVQMDVDCEPWNKIYVASAYNVADAADALPHWTPATLLEEFCRFFNVTVIADQFSKSVRIVNYESYLEEMSPIEITPVREYTSEVNQENQGKSLATDNLEFDLADSEGHDYDIITEEIRGSEEVKEYASKQEATTAFYGMTESERMKYIFKTPVGMFAGWEHNYSDVGESGSKVLFTQIDVFAPLERVKSTSRMKLKICPVGMLEVDNHYEQSYAVGGSTMTVTGDDRFNGPTMSDRVPVRGSFSRSSSDESAEDTMQDYILGNASKEKYDKEDRMEVMFIDDVLQPYWYKRNKFDAVDTTASIGFTDWQYKKAHKGSTHNRWSLSLNNTEADKYLGQLHNQSFSFNTKVKHCFKFLSKELPDPTRVFMVRNKRYGCEKIEANVSAAGIDQLLTGYFYEIVS